jgi:hypothetical protein
MSVEENNNTSQTYSLVGEEKENRMKGVTIKRGVLFTRDS